MRTTSRNLLACAALCAWSAAACSGSIEDGNASVQLGKPGPKGTGAKSGAANGSGGTGSDAGDEAEQPEVALEQRPARFACADPAARGRGQLAMRRLTRDELLDSIGAVVGAEVMRADAIVRAAERIPDEAPGDLVAAFQNGHSFDHVEGILLTAQAVAAEVAAEDAVRDAVLGECASDANRACAEAFLDTTALRLLRRPLDAQRRTALLDAFAGEGAGIAGMQWLLARILQAPESVFHLELPRVQCEAVEEAASEPIEYAWDDASVFFAPNGGEQQGPQERLTQAGWYVWQIPADRVASDCAELSITLDAEPGDAPLSVDVNLDDAPLLPARALEPGEQTLRAPVSIAKGDAVKVGVYFNPSAGQTLALRALALIPMPGAEQCAEVAAEDGLIALDDWSVASRVAFALTGEGPDASLLAAAAKGELRSEDQVLPHARRLLGTPAARRQLEAIFDAWLDLHAIPTPHPAIAARLGVEPKGLADEARQELLEYATHMILEREADTAELMSARLGFPRSERMATLYGTDVVEGDEPVELARGHAGLLLRIAPLLSGQLGSSPILRGVYVRKRILCDVLPSPDFTIVNSRLKQFEAVNRKALSTREAVTQITAEGACPTCHQRINPLGFPLETFDPLGQPRSEEIVFDKDGEELARHPIDTRVSGANIESGGPNELASAAELNQELAGSAKVRACIAERLYSHAQLRPVAAADDCALAEVEQSLRAGGSVQEAWLRAVVNTELFVRTEPEAAP